ncbi:MAG: transglutaminase domain-containing protein [Eubacteriales bacterium]|nr:transglutaminase domain-containing protein [Eubacteriales bacterium]
MKKKLTGALAVAVAAAAAAGIYGYACLPRVAEELTVEAGSPVPAAGDFLDRDFEGVTALKGLEETMDMNRIADYDVILEIGHSKYHSVLHVTDTTAPALAVRDVEAYTFETVEAEDFVESVEDATEVTVELAAQPDMTKTGRQTVELRAVDQGGNVTAAQAELTVLEDVEPPVIEGVRELTVTAGESVSYKNGVTVSDDCDPDPTLTVIRDGVDPNTPGDYAIVYQASDRSGNTAEVSTVLHVIGPTSSGVTEETVNAAADKILAQITTADMSQYQVAQAIYNWAHSQIAYVDGSNKDNWVQAAYDGLVRRRGDCYVYAMASKCLLTRAGITNMDIHKIPTNTLHYWNLIDIGEGWHHFDTTRRKDGATFFYLTDAELMAYSDTHKGTHEYDRSLYPEIP